MRNRRHRVAASGTRGRRGHSRNETSVRETPPGFSRTPGRGTGRVAAVEEDWPSGSWRRGFAHPWYTKFPGSSEYGTSRKILGYTIRNSEGIFPRCHIGKFRMVGRRKTDSWHLGKNLSEFRMVQISENQIMASSEFSLVP